MPKEIVVKVIKNLAEQQGLNPTTLIAISWCESRHDVKAIGLNKRNGEVWSKDLSLFQLNDFYHLEDATKMGFDIKNPLDNIKYALYLYKKDGLKPWMASHKCISNYAGQGIT